MPRMRFNRDMFYNDLEKPLYEAGKVYDVPDEMVTRWLKRGGEIVDEAPAELPKGQDLDEGLEPVKEKVDDKADVGVRKSQPQRRYGRR